jgi:hypothetical protein
MKLKGICFAFLVISLLISPNFVKAVSPTTIYIKSESQRVSTGDIVRVHLGINDSYDLYASSLAIKYDPHILEVISDGIEDGDWGPSYILKNQVSQGMIYFLSTLVNIRDGLEGNINIGTIRFLAKKPGITEISIEQGSIINSKAQKVAFHMEERKVTIDIAVNPVISEKPTYNPFNSIRWDLDSGRLSRFEGFQLIQDIFFKAGTIELITKQNLYNFSYDDLAGKIKDLTELYKALAILPANISSNIKPVIVFTPTSGNRDININLDKEAIDTLKIRGISVAINLNGFMAILPHDSLEELEGFNLKELYGDDLNFLKADIDMNQHPTILGVFILEIKNNREINNVLYKVYSSTDGRNKLSGYHYNGETWDILPTKSLNHGIEFTGPHGKIAVMDYMTGFSDIDSHWAKEEIELLSSRMILRGDGKAFNPNNPITRGEFSAIIARALLLPMTETPLPFRDVLDIHWYYDYVSRSFTSGIIKGKGDDSFEPSSNITREEMAVMISRALDYIGKSTLNERDIPYTDIMSISRWAIDEVRNVYRMGIMTGRNLDTFAPKSLATRAEAAIVIIRMLYQM